MDELELQLVREAGRGDARALELLYDRYRARLFGFLVRQLRRPELAEDVFQEVWIKVFRTISRFDPNRGNFRGWLFRIAGNAAIDRLRRGQVRAAHEQAEDDTTSLDEQYSTFPDPERVQAARDSVALVFEVLDTLPPLQRTAVLLRHQQQLSYREISHALQVPEGTAKTLVHRGTLTLRSACRRGGSER